LIEPLIFSLLVDIDITKENFNDFISLINKISKDVSFFVDSVSESNIIFLLKLKLKIQQKKNIM